MALLLCCAAVGAQPPPPWLLQAEQMIADEPDAALALADNAVAAAEQIGDQRAAYAAYRGRAGLHRRTGQYGQAVLDLERALAAARRLDDPAAVAEAEHGLGVAFSMSGLHPEALGAFERALEAQTRLGNWDRASAALTNIGNVLSDSSDPDGARDYYERALAMKRRHGIDSGTGILLNNLGDLDREAGELERAQQLLAEAIDRHARLGEHDNESIARGNLGYVLAERGDFQGALHQFEVAEQRAAGAEVRLQVAAHVGRADTYLRMARAAPADSPLRGQRLDRAFDAIERAATLAAGMDDPHRRSQIAGLASDIHAERGDPARALTLLREAGELAREHDRRADSARQAVLAARFRNAQQRSEIAELHEQQLRQTAEIQRQRGIALLLGLGALGLGAAATLLLRQVRQRRHHGVELSARNVALGDALLEADEQRQRAERIAALNRRLLTLAGDDLREPLLRIRSLAERVLVEHRGEAALERQVASIAQQAGELMRLADQITESAALVDGSDEPVAGCNVLALLRELVDQVDARVPGRDGRLRLAGDNRAVVRVEPRRLDRVLHELIDAVLQHNSGKAPIAIELGRHDGWVELRIDDPSTEVVRRIGAGGGNVGLAFARGVIRELGGSIGGEPAGEPVRLLVRLPAA